MEPDPALSAYIAKRDLAATPEPAADASAPAGGAPRFVVQRHSARALHFDLRLEERGVLASFAVPKGPPLRVGPRRLAVRTEDHPLAYLDFAGVIPPGQYGAGRMTIWDRGTYETILRTGGEWKVILAGGVLRGEYHLVRTGGRAGRDEWLVLRSAKGPPGPPDPAGEFAGLRPMLAVERAVSEAPLDDPAWTVEVKWDGYRALALVTGDGTTLRSRGGIDLAGRFPHLADLRRAVLAQEALLDGEVVVLDEAGRADFGRLQAGEGDPVYMAFDLLYADGEWLLEAPLVERRARLEALLDPDARRVTRSDHVRGHGRALYEHVRARGVEGVVAKRAESRYAPGRRSPDWVKVKGHREDELVIGGYAPGEGARRATLRGLLVGEPVPGGRLRFLASVGGGLSEAALRTLRVSLDARRAEESPFDGPVDPPGAVWVRPELRCRVRYAERTRDGRLRAPVFVGLVEPDPVPTRDRPDEMVLREGERTVRLTNLGKVFWPRLGITKGDLIDHYLRVAPHLVPHLAGRALVLKRYPNGADAAYFFQHQLPEGAPGWLRRASLARSDRPDAAPITYAVVDDPLALAWVVNLGCIDLNPWQSRVDAPDRPTHLLVDLDPAEGLPFDRVVEAAHLMRELLAGLGLRSYPKTSGASGLHLFVPIRPDLPAAGVVAVAQTLAEAAARSRPDLVSVERRVADRGPRVYVDALQSGFGRSIASVYSVRPVPAATISTPLTWEEVTPALRPERFTMGEVARRVAARGDLFAPVLTDLQDLRAAAGG